MACAKDIAGAGPIGFFKVSSSCFFLNFVVFCNFQLFDRSSAALMEFMWNTRISACCSVFLRPTTDADAQHYVQKLCKCLQVKLINLLFCWTHHKVTVMRVNCVVGFPSSVCTSWTTYNTDVYLLWAATIAVRWRSSSIMTLMHRRHVRRFCLLTGWQDDVLASSISVPY